jgi:hypothetical protein
MKCDKIKKDLSQVLSLKILAAENLPHCYRLLSTTEENNTPIILLKDKKAMERISYAMKTSSPSFIEYKVLLILPYLKNNLLQDYYSLIFVMIQLQFSYFSEAFDGDIHYEKISDK